MKYSLRSLMIVVTLVCIVSSLVAGSRYCTEQAANHRKEIPSDSEWQFVRSQVHFFKSALSPNEITYWEQQEEWYRFHKESSAAYERVSWMPWLPLSLPQVPSPLGPIPETAALTKKPVDPKEKAEKEKALDALRTRLAKEAREKYGVP